MPINDAHLEGIFIFPDLFSSWGFLFKVYFTINIGTFSTFTTNKCKHII